MRKNFNELKAIIILTILLLTIPTVLAIEKWIIPVTADLESRCGFKTFAEAILDCDNKINLTAHFINLGTVNLTAKFRADIFDSNSILIKTLETPSQNVSVGNTITFFLTDTLSTKPSYAVFIIYYDFDERGLDNPLNITQNETFKDVCRKVDKWWSDTEFVPMSDPRYDNSFFVDLHNDTSYVSSTNPGGFYLNINITNIPNTSSITITDTISGEIRPTGDFVRWPTETGMPLHVYADGNDVTSKFNFTFNNKTLIVNLNPGEFISADVLYITFHIRYALIDTVLTDAERAMFPRAYTNLASANVNDTITDSSIAVLTAYLKLVGGGPKDANDDTILGGTGAFLSSTIIVDEISPKYDSISVSGTQADSLISHNIFWTDDNGLSGYIFSFDNCEGSFVNDSWVSFTDGWSNVTKMINSTAGCTVNWKVYANDTSDNWNSTSDFSYSTTPPDTSAPMWSDNSTSGTLSGNNIQHSVLWNDDVQLSGYIFSFDNCEDSFVNDTWTPSIDNWSNITKTINSTVGCDIKWKIYANDSSDNWNVTDDFVYTTTEQPDISAPTWSDNSTSGTSTRTHVQHLVLWNDNKQLSGYIFSFDNCEGLLVNESWNPFLDNWSNFTKTINSTLGCTVNWMFYANDTSNNWGLTDLFSYTTS